MATGSAKRRALRQRGCLKMKELEAGELVSGAGVTDAGGRGCRAARLRL
jgi:hypothetical protein